MVKLSIEKLKEEPLTEGINDAINQKCATRLGSVQLSRYPKEG